jgi:hypothetical protein
VSQGGKARARPRRPRFRPRHPDPHPASRSQNPAPIHAGLAAAGNPSLPPEEADDRVRRIPRATPHPSDEAPFEMIRRP